MYSRSRSGQLRRSTRSSQSRALARTSCVHRIRALSRYAASRRQCSSCASSASSRGPSSGLLHPPSANGRAVLGPRTSLLVWTHGRGRHRSRISGPTPRLPGDGGNRLCLLRGDGRSHDHLVGGERVSALGLHPRHRRAARVPAAHPARMGDEPRPCRPPRGVSPEPAGGPDRSRHGGAGHAGCHRPVHA